MWKDLLQYGKNSLQYGKDSLLCEKSSINNCELIKVSINQSQYIRLHFASEIVDLQYDNSISNYTINQLIVILRTVIDIVISN